ncbi:MAG TPA: glycosyltransferase family 4 protein [bacterium]|jgi:glycosyltransferase involved in cell wall biosynthesis|nr:glycosyltransferase family 4 protein [bacterium]
MPPIKVAIIVTRLDLGGAQEVALRTALGLDPGRFDVRLLCGEGGQLDEEARRLLGPRFVVVPFLRHPISPLNDLAAAAWLWNYLVREGVRVVHTHSSKAGLLGRLAAFFARTPRVAHTVHGWSFNDFQSGPAFMAFVLMERRLARVTDHIIVVASSLRDKGLLLGVGRPDRYALVRAAVDLPAWSRTPRSRAALKKILPDLKARVVGVVANLKAQKAPLDFVRIAALVCRGRKDVDFVYIGDGPLRPEAEALARSLGLSGRIHFLGWQRSPRQLAAGFDVFLLPSLYEGLPCVFPEVLSLGVPVVASQVDGAAEIVKEGSNGFLCQPRDCEAMADRVAALLDRPALLRRLSAGAKRSVGAEFSYGAMLERTAAIYAS